MDAEEFLSTQTAYCKPLHMRLTPEGCLKLRMRQTSYSSRSRDIDDPPPQCLNCPGISAVASTAGVSEKVEETKREEIVSEKVQYSMQELADMVGVRLKDVQKAKHQRLPFDHPDPSTRAGKVVCFMRERGLDWGDITLSPKICPENGSREQADVEPASSSPDADAGAGADAASPDSDCAEEPASSRPENAPADEVAPGVRHDADKSRPDLGPPDEDAGAGVEPAAFPRPENASADEEAPSEPDIAPSAGVTYDFRKQRLDLIPSEALRAMGEVLAFGVDKYGDCRERGFDCSYSALLHHLLAWHDKEPADPESGLSHLAHALTIAGILVTRERRGKASAT